MKRNNAFYVIAALTVVVLGVALLVQQGGWKDSDPVRQENGAKKVPSARVQKASASHGGAKRVADESDRTSAPEGAAKGSEDKADENESPQALSEEEQRERDEEKSVEAFDGLTDKWMEPAKDGVTMKDIDEFVAQFRKVPKARKDECLHRALNLVPDENVMLLAGILMDKTQDKELIETVYNDVLNRDESVKKPILQQIFKDREHPCWTDTAWILDVTGELPAKK